MNNPRKPTLFNPESDNLKITPSEEPVDVHENLPIENAEQTIPPASKSPSTIKSRLISWGFLLFSSLAGLFALWLSATIITSIQTLFKRNDLIGWAALILAVLALLSLTILLIREIRAIFKLKKLGNLKSTGQQIYNDNNLKPARRYLKNIKQLYGDAPERRWIIKRLEEKENEIMDGRELLELIDQQVGSTVDQEARKIISETARKVSLITAIAPGPLLDMLAVTMLNVNMVRKIAQLYGVRPGFWGMSRLARNIISHLALSGGIAITSDLLQPLIGSGIAAKLSKRLGEGLFNGALTIRIGISALEITRPIPYLVAKKLSFAKIVSSSLQLKPGKTEPKA